VSEWELQWIGVGFTNDSPFSLRGFRRSTA
jgi:hypothetical protein